MRESTLQLEAVKVDLLQRGGYEWHDKDISSRHLACAIGRVSSANGPIPKRAALVNVPTTRRKLYPNSALSEQIMC